MDFKLLEELVRIPGTSGDEGKIKAFLMAHVADHKNKWKQSPKVISEGIQDNLILVFGKPTMAFYAHLDTVGFTARYQNQLLGVGGVAAETGFRIAGEDSYGAITCNLQTDEEGRVFHDFQRSIEPGTPLCFAEDYNQSSVAIRTPYLDNRLSIWNMLTLCPTLTNCAIVFTTFEEHGGGSVGYLSALLHAQYQLEKAIIADVTWHTDGVKMGGGPVLSLRDQYIPRRRYLDEVIGVINRSDIPVQMEVEGEGASDGKDIQLSAIPMDWCFVGLAIDNMHTPFETAKISDIEQLLKLYSALSDEM